MGAGLPGFRHEGCGACEIERRAGGARSHRRQTSQGGPPKTYRVIDTLLKSSRPNGFTWYPSTP